MNTALTKCVTIVEVGPRDGFQNLKQEIPTEDKVRIIDLLVDAGLKRIEASSFVHPRWIPQLKDAAEVFARIQKKPGVSYSALIPNEKGLDRAIESGVGEVVYVVCASDSLNRENFNKSTTESLAELSAIAEKAKQNAISLRGVIGGSFGCPFEGNVPVESIIEVAKEFQIMGICEISLADTIGIASPHQVRDMLSRLLMKINNIPISVHFHDTRGIGLANVYAAFEAGVTIFESSIFGLGGCPYAPGAPGNVATEGVVHMFHGMGVETGVDLDKLAKCAEVVSEIIRRTSGLHGLRDLA